MTATGPTVFVPADTAASCVGADDVAAALAPHVAAAGGRLVRTGSRGMLWLEPLVEVCGDDGVRRGFGPVSVQDVPSLLQAGLLDAGLQQAGRVQRGDVDHRLALGRPDALAWLADQTRWSFERVGVVDPASPLDYVDHGGLDGLRAALAMPAQEVVDQVIASGLRGRGGAGFPAGVKWRTVAQAQAESRDRADRTYVVCNADEGDSGTYADRMLCEGDPFSTLEGMLIAAYATGASRGYIYVRSEYPRAVAALRTAVSAAYEQGWLGPHVLGSELSFDVELRVGAGAYICGEETSMLESIEGRRALVRSKPPIPAQSGLFGRPTLVHNLLTLASVPRVLAAGASSYSAAGVARSRGTQVFQLSGNVARGGIVEAAFGVSLAELVHTWGGGTASGRPVGAVQVGGPLGAYLGPDQLDLPMDYEAFAAAGAMVGHGGIVVFDDTVDLLAAARFAMQFCAQESCGKCTPCRIGSVRGAEILGRVVAGGAGGSAPSAGQEQDLALLEDLCEVMVHGSACAMGALTPLPVRSAISLWRKGLGEGSGQ